MGKASCRNDRLWEPPRFNLGLPGLDCALPSLLLPIFPQCPPPRPEIRGHPTYSHLMP